MTRIEQIRALLAEVDALRSQALGRLPEELEDRWRGLQAELEDLALEEWLAQDILRRVLEWSERGKYGSREVNAARCIELHPKFGGGL